MAYTAALRKAKPTSPSFEGIDLLHNFFFPTDVESLCKTRNEQQFVSGNV